MDFVFLTTCLLPLTIHTISYAYGYPQSDFHRFPLEDFLNSQENVDDRSASHRIADGERNSFFPSFSPFEPPPLGHSRPFLFQPEGAFSQKPKAFQNDLNNGIRKLFSKDDSTSSNFNSRQALLGSGNFGVLRGGTFYNDHDGDASDVDYQYRSYNRNGHGRPSYNPNSSQNPKPQMQQFANFKDFADINTPSYSHFVVVYAKPNNSIRRHDEEVIQHAPNNIIERLEMLDEERERDASERLKVPRKKLSKAKQKLAKLKPEKKWKVKNTTTTSKPLNDITEPMLALS